MTKSDRLRALCMALAVLAVGIPVGVAWAHWSITSRLMVPEPGRTFQLRLHYEILAGQANPDEALKVCFWLERHQGNRYAAAQDRKVLPFQVD